VTCNNICYSEYTKGQVTHENTSELGPGVCLGKVDFFKELSIHDKRELEDRIICDPEIYSLAT
jgi:hypothetical protein